MGIRRLVILSFALTNWLGPASATAQEPEATFRINIDFRNLVSPDKKEALSLARVEGLLGEVNRIYSSCRVEFVARKILEIDANSFSVHFPPNSESDLAALAERIHPHGFAAKDEALPITFAGNFDFFTPTYGIRLFGLTWAFFRGHSDILRMHSIIARQHLDSGAAIEILAHEMGHFFLLSHSVVSGNIMGSGRQISPDQCRQIRNMATTYLKPVLASAPVVSSARG